MVDPIPAPSALLKADPKVSLTFHAEKDGKLRVTYQGWSDAQVFQPGESIELLVRAGQVQAFRRGTPTPQVDPYEGWEMAPEPSGGEV
jgi:hypothetical protein